MGIVNTVASHISNSNNYTEIRHYLAATIGKPVTEMNLRDKQSAIEMLAQDLYESITDLNNSRPQVEQRWSFLGNVRPIIEAIYGENVQFQQRTDTLTDREVLQQAADQLAASDLTDGERDVYLIVWHYLTPLKSRTKAEQNWYKNSIFLQYITRSLQLL